MDEQSAHASNVHQVQDAGISHPATRLPPHHDLTAASNRVVPASMSRVVGESRHESDRVDSKYLLGLSCWFSFLDKVLESFQQLIRAALITVTGYCALRQTFKSLLSECQPRSAISVWFKFDANQCGDALPRPLTPCIRESLGRQPFCNMTN